MSKIKKLECSGCGGTLREEGKFYICENCGTKYMLGRDDAGNPFTYCPIEKKEIQSGQMAAKAATIKTDIITVKEIKLSDNIDSDVHRESSNIDTEQNLQLISRFLGAKEWEAAQVQINQILLSDRNNAQVRWFEIMCSRHLSNEKELLRALSAFTVADGKIIDVILSNATPKFARHIIELIFSNDYQSDSALFTALKAILPYAKNEAVYSNSKFKSITNDAILYAINKSYEKSFDYLISTTLESNEVDTYLSYIEKFAGNCSPIIAQKYYRKFLVTDPGNMRILSLLLKCDIKSDATTQQCVIDFENLLKYSDNADKEVIDVLNAVNSENVTTDRISQFVWKLIGYHSGAPEALRNQILLYSRVLLQSALWNQARTFLQLILSFDAQNADAYWGLCLVRLQARNESEIENKKENLIDCPEFKKALALYQTCGDETRTAELMSYTQKQKTRQKSKKVIACLSVVAVFVVIAFFAFNLMKYNTNVYVGFSKDTLSANWVSETIPMEFKNKGFVDISYFSGVMYFYDESGKKLSATKLELSNLPHGKKQELDLTLDSDSVQKLSDYSFASLKITFAITQINYSDYTFKDFGDGKEKTIKSSTESNKKAQKEKNEKLQKSFDAAMKAYDTVDVNSPTFETDIVNAVSKLDDIWDDVLKSKALLKDMYNKACTYQKNAEYEKAYFLFALLAKYDYEDSNSKANDCYSYASSDYYR